MHGTTETKKKSLVTVGINRLRKIIILDNTVQKRLKNERKEKICCGPALYDKNAAIKSGLL